MLSNEAIAAEWAAALKDSGVAPGDVAFWPLEGFADYSDGDTPASTHPPDRCFVDEDLAEPLEALGYPVEDEMRARVTFITDFLIA
jgi:hypothetical protein